jgi:hypothetical protein
MRKEKVMEDFGGIGGVVDSEVGKLTSFERYNIGGKIVNENSTYVTCSISYQGKAIAEQRSIKKFILCRKRNRLYIVRVV